MTFSGPAGSPENDGAPLTRREARALREAAAAGPHSAAAVALAVPQPAAPLTFRRFPSAAAASPPASPASRTAPPRRARRGKAVAKIVTLVAIPALFLTAGLPSYAFSPQGGVGGVSAQPIEDTQAVSVGAGAATVSVSPDGFTATSQAELDAIEAALARQRAAEAASATAAAAAAAASAASSAAGSAASFSSYSSVGVRAEGDDYPWPAASTLSQGGGLSALGYYYRECVDFVAWRLNRDAGSTGSPWRWTWSKLTPTGGNGSAWAAAWAAQGRPTGKTPVVGSVASFNYNHVAYVQSVPGDGTVVLEEYNWMGSHAYHTRTVPISEVKLFLYPPA